MQNKQKGWPDCTAVIISTSTNTSLMLKQILASKGWYTTLITESYREAIECVRSRKAHLILVDDTPELPALAVMRQLLLDPIAVLTPKITILLNQNEEEAVPIQRMSITFVVFKPITPTTFIPVLVKMMKVWERKQFTLLRRITTKINSNPEAPPLEIVDIFDQLAKLQEIRVLVIGAKALFLIANKQLKNAESTLLPAVRQNPRDLTTPLLLGHLYMICGQPNLAFKVFSGIQAQHRTSSFVLSDMAQAKILVDDFHMARRFLIQMVNKEFLTEKAYETLGRIYMAAGKEQEGKSALGGRSGLFARIKKSWESVEFQKKAPTQESEVKTS